MKINLLLVRHFCNLIWIPFAALAVVSCQKEEPLTFDEQRAILMSTGWKLDRLVLHFNDDRPGEETDTLVLVAFRSDKEEQKMTVYTDRWIVFENDTLALTAFNLDVYSRENEGAEWELTSRNNTGVGGTDWGPDSDGMPHLSLKKEWPIRILLVSGMEFILENAYRIETVEEILSGGATLTYLFGGYPSGTLESIDAVYRAAGPDEGPNWFPPWFLWPTGYP